MASAARTYGNALSSCELKYQTTLRLVLGLEDSAREASVCLSPVGKRGVESDSDGLERDADVVNGQGRVVIRGRVAVDNLH